MIQLQKHDYFYFISSLPEMVLDQSRAPFSVEEYVSRLEDELQPEDWEQVRLLLLRYDNRNLLRLLREDTEHWHPLGRYSEAEMREALKAESGLPEYMHRFAHAYQNEQPVDPEKSWENQLTSLYYEYALDHSEGFLYDWLIFERDLNDILTAWNIRQYQLKAEGQLIGKGETTEALQRSRSRDFGLGSEYAYLNKLLSELERDDLTTREKAIDRIQWNYINEQLTFHYFTVEVVLGYLLQLQMLERWLSLDPQAGQQRVRDYISEIEQKIQLT